MWTMEQTLYALADDPLSSAGLLQVLRRGTGELLRAEPAGVLLRDSVSGIYLLGGIHGAEAQSWVSRRLDNLLMIVGNEVPAAKVRADWNAEWIVECDQYVYEGTCPAAPAKLRIAEAEPAEMELIAANYDILSRTELDQVAAHRTLFAGHDAAGSLVGFAGAHLEGSMGLLKILPAYRRNGYAAELERFVIRRFMENRLIPFGQVETNNAASAALQRKLGLTKAPQRAYWIG